ncbi:MAG TPA: Ig-like domain-containing protein, partial [bacterium]|nr:Ig-like domain-containing protein [bacterium]
MRRSLISMFTLVILVLFGVWACDESTTEPDGNGNGDQQDMESPTVSVSLSTQADTISGEVTITAEATDNDKVDSVQFFVDDQRITTATSSPYETNWQTITSADSMSHEVYAKAYDPAENSAESSKISRVVVPFMVSLSANVQPIFSANCTGCHGGNGGLFLTSDQAYDNLVNTESVGYAPMNRVVPGSPENSVLYLKVTGDQQVGQRMPQGGSALSD